MRCGSRAAGPYPSPPEFGPDAPVAPLDPRPGIAAAVGRTGDERPARPPEQCLPVRAALTAAARARALIRVAIRLTW